MQGRLLPKYKGRYQAFPPNTWREEFQLAADLGLDLIEFILDFEDAMRNPLMDDLGLRDILSTVEQTGVQVRTICADYFMEAPLHDSNQAVRDNSRKVLERLVLHASLLGVADVVIPCVDQSSLKDPKDVDFFCETMKAVIPLAERTHVNMALETDLAPGPFCALLERLDSPCVSVNYDTGNSAALGYDPVEELAAYGERITDIHIKDRVLGGGPVELGQGDARFQRFFKALAPLDYEGSFIMQAWRDDEGLAAFKRQLGWIMPFLEDTLHATDQGADS